MNAGSATSAISATSAARRHRDPQPHAHTHTATHKTDNTRGTLLPKSIVLCFWEGQREHKVLPGGHNRAREGQFCGHRIVTYFWEGQRAPSIVAGSRIVTPLPPHPSAGPQPFRALAEVELAEFGLSEIEIGRSRNWLKSHWSMNVFF